ncbi:winged helix-turn-helix domain-containing protein [Caulobacter segnis]|uniref:winged helix-turn-helix domain-containing protein n=1 Tax=Caulobacter segnis TaxID=88688 RepID=UPI00240FFC48|nr:winged helix-turn-helix domain-containing protein [Caulobacter segnis]MDG2522094.1 winged helix-turn-helix domain-containing protein [Caulobacter segnis]
MTVEPRVMEVLVALHRANGETLSRDELNAVCWMGRVVSLDAQTQAVARLRRVLIQDPSVEVETVSKIGYRLRVSEPVAPVLRKANNPPMQRRRLPMFAAAAFGATTAAAAFAVIWMASNAAGAASSLAAVEREGADVTLSPDGLMRAFASAPRGGQRDIYLHVMAKGAPVRLTRTDADEYGPVWSPRGDRLAFVRHTSDDKCLILTAVVQERSERIVGRCSGATSTRLTWADGDTLISSDRAETDGARRILVLDVRDEEGADAFQLAALNRQPLKRPLS